LETFAEPKELVENPHYAKQRLRNLANLADAIIDAPIVEIIEGFNRLPYCFTLQSCYGHFLYKGQNDNHNIDPLPITNSLGRVEYRIAYLALCIENSELGSKLLEAMKEITFVDPENIQLCSAEWFWKRQANSYALQVEPDRFKHQDKAMLDHKEALYIEKIRNKFFAQLKELLQK